MENSKKILAYLMIFFSILTSIFILSTIFGYGAIQNNLQDLEIEENPSFSLLFFTSLRPTLYFNNKQTNKQTKTNKGLDIEATKSYHALNTVAPGTQSNLSIKADKRTLAKKFGLVVQGISAQQGNTSWVEGKSGFCCSPV